jgi:hypothetical protein
MAGLRPSLAALLLFLAGTAVAAQAPDRPRLKCLDYQVPKLRICTELDAKELGGAGRSTMWTVHLRPGVKIRLHNHSPSVVSLEGGNDQIVASDRSGTVQRKVTSISTLPGTATLLATPYDSSPERESAILAAVLVPLLQRAEARFAQGRERLPESAYSAESVRRLLDATEYELLEALSYPELAALRGYVQVRFREGRAELTTTLAAARVASAVSRPRVLSALWTGSSRGLAPQVAGLPSPGTTLRKEVANSVLDQILQRIRRLLEIARPNNLYTRLCVVSTPRDARFMMRPQISEASERVEINTNGELQAYRGLYVFSIRKGFRQRIDCQTLDNEDCIVIDLVDDPKPILHCDFEKRNCERRPGPVLAGVCHGSGF